MVGCLGSIFRGLLFLVSILVVIFGGFFCIMNFFGALFSGEWSSFLTIFSVWLVASYALGWLFEGPWKKDDVGEGESCLTFLLYLLVIGVYRVVNWFGRLVFRIK